MEEPAVVNKAGMAGCRSPMGIASERAVSVQTRSNNAILQEYMRSRSFKAPIALPLRDGQMGEELLLGDEVSASNLCIGDIIEILRDGLVVLRLVITSPRRPCSKVDLAFGATYTRHGVRAYAASNGLAGFFCSVVHTGTVMKGDLVRVKAGPHSAWTLERVSQMMYGHPVAVMKYSARGIYREEWGGSQGELVELADIQVLAVHEWREELFKLLDRRPIGRYKNGSAVGSTMMATFACLPGSLVQRTAAMLMEWKMRKRAAAASKLPVISRAELAKHCTRNDLWMSIHGRVYDLTSFAPTHPGGATLLMEHAGADGSEAFDAQHNEKVLSRVRLVGRLEAPVKAHSMDEDEGAHRASFECTFGAGPAPTALQWMARAFPTHTLYECPVIASHELCSDVSFDSGSVVRLELACAGRTVENTQATLRYEGADNLGVCCDNGRDLAFRVATALSLDFDAVFTVLPIDKSRGGGGVAPLPTPCTVEFALRYHIDLRKPLPQPLLHLLAVHATAPAESTRLLHLSSAAGKDEYAAYVQRDGRGLADLLADFPSSKPPFSALLEVAPRLTARYYTISSSPLCEPTSVHLTIKVASPKLYMRVYENRLLIQSAFSVCFSGTARTDEECRS